MVEQSVPNRAGEPASLIAGIIEDLQRTGYPTEIVAARQMQRRDWYVVHNPSYLDDVEKRSREFDIHALRSSVMREAAENVLIAYMYTRLVVECKKSDKPWVFFTTAEHNTSSRSGRLIQLTSPVRNLFWPESSPHTVIPFDELSSLHHYFHEKERARTFHEPFKNTAQHAPMIYTAILSTIKAVLFYLAQPSMHDVIGLYYPVVIFDGPLFVAKVGQQKEITLEEVQYLQLSHHYTLPAKTRTDWDTEREFIIDIVHESHVDDYLLRMEREHNVIAAKLRSALLRGELSLPK